MPDRQRCSWCGKAEDYQIYHDTEWGFPVADDRQLFEKLCLEGFQSGLSWITILRKRDNFRKAFADFNLERMARWNTRSVDRLVQDAGHELRTPLTSLRTNLSVLRRHPDMEPAMQKRILDDVDGEVGELTNLVNELVAVASGELADQPPQDVFLGEIAQRVAERVGRRRGRDITVDVESVAPVHVPLAGVERAIANLIENAAKFDQSGGAIRVEVAAGRLTVFDNGPGIPNDDLPLVFERFHRGAVSRTLPGSGLGLAIVREVVERHGGSVHAANRADGGAAVGFELPVERPSSGH